MSGRPPTPNVLDRTIEWMFPRWGYQRECFRNATSVARDYTGGSRSDPHLDDWQVENSSGDAHLAHGRRETMIARSRWLERNSAIGRAIGNTLVRSVVGCGIQPRPMLNTEALGLSPDQAEEFKEIVGTYWPVFVREACADECGDFYEQQALAERRALYDGDVTTRIVRVNRPGRMFQTAAQLIEGDLICTPSSRENDPAVRDGVVRGKSKQPIAYYVADQYPGDLGMFAEGLEVTFTKILVWDGRGIRLASMLARRTRATQTRGEPEIAPVLTRLRHFEETTGSEVVARRIESCITGVIETDTAAGARRFAKRMDGGLRKMKFGPGQFPVSRPGETIKIHEPKRPGSNYEAFATLVLREIGAPLELPLESLLLDWSKTTYSSGRAGVLEARRGFKRRQKKLVAEHSHPVYVAWLEELYLTGMLPTWVRNFYELLPLWTAATWIPDGWRWVDPAKEGKAAEIQLAKGITSVPAEIEQQGGDWQDVTRRQIRYELWKQKERQRMAEEMGVELEGPPPSGEGGGGQDEPSSGDGGSQSGDGESVPPSDESAEQEKERERRAEALA